jgi:hypothetical protein
MTQRSRAAHPAPPDAAGLQAAARAAAYADLLADHDATAADGAPLLTGPGVSHVRRLVLAARAGSAGPRGPGLPLPHWDGVRRQFWLGPRLLRQFRRPAPAQAAVLAAFQAGGWAAGHAPDPIPREPGDTEDEARHRLHETVKNLNRGLPPGTIRFRTDGGTGLWWEYAPPPIDTRPTPNLHPTYPL